VRLDALETFCHDAGAGLGESAAVRTYARLGLLLTAVVSLIVAVAGGALPQTPAATAQGAPGVEWSRDYSPTGDDAVSSVIQTHDGGYAFVGTTHPVSGNEDIWLVKTDPSGQVTWQRNFGTGQSWGDEGFDVKQTADGGFIVVGSCSQGEAHPGYVDSRLCLLRADAEGNLVWSKNYGTMLYDGEIVPVWYSKGYSVVVADDGGFVAAGVAQSLGGYDGWLIKTDSNGEKVWDAEQGAWTVGWESIFRGFVSYDEPVSVDKTTDGGYIVALHNGNPADVWLIKTDGSGLPQWDRTFDHESCGDFPHSVTQTSDGRYLIAAELQSCASGIIGWLIRTDATGVKDWELVTAPPDLISTAQQTTDGGIIVFVFRYDPYGFHTLLLNKLDIEGNEVWQKLVDQVIGPNDGLQTADGGFLVAGSFNNSHGLTTRLVKLGPETTPGPPVGGIAELPDASDSSGRNYVALAALAAAVLLALTAGAWHARRRWLG
jgi:hypothetical protein